MNILITGTSSGIGEALADAYLDRGDVVFGISRHESSRLAGRENYHHLSQDIAEFSYSAIHTANFLKGVRTLDLVVLNAGILNQIKEMKNTSVDELQESMNINVWGNKVVLDTALEMCEVRQAVTISSGAAVHASRGWNAYAISKAALKMMTELYAAENPGTHFSSVAPGLVDTGMQEYLTGLDSGDKFPLVDRLKKARGTADMPPPDEVAPRLIEVFEKVRSQPSGTFTDVRRQ